MAGVTFVASAQAAPTAAVSNVTQTSVTVTYSGLTPGTSYTTDLMSGGALLLSTPFTTIAPPPPATSCTGSADLTAGSTSAFSVNTTTGATLTNQADGSMLAHTPSGSGNKYARGVWDLNVPANSSEFCYSVDVFLPSGFYAATQNQVAVMRWDNYGHFADQADNGGLFINSDDHWRLLLGSYGGPQTLLVGPFDVPENQWTHIDVFQDFDSTPRNEVRVNGTSVGSSTISGDNGRVIDRMRVGIVAIAAGAQTNALDLKFDNTQVWLP